MPIDDAPKVRRESACDAFAVGTVVKIAKQGDGDGSPTLPLTFARISPIVAIVAAARSVLAV